MFFAFSVASCSSTLLRASTTPVAVAPAPLIAAIDDTLALGLVCALLRAVTKMSPLLFSSPAPFRRTPASEWLSMLSSTTDRPKPATPSSLMRSAANTSVWASKLMRPGVAALPWATRRLPLPTVISARNGSAAEPMSVSLASALMPIRPAEPDCRLGPLENSDFTAWLLALTSTLPASTVVLAPMRTSDELDTVFSSSAPLPASRPRARFSALASNCWV